jgi:hypothetical protein
LWLLKVLNWREVTILARVDAQHLRLLLARLAPSLEPLVQRRTGGAIEDRLRLSGCMICPVLDDSQMTAILAK